ncbi:MAG: TetR family transcriptional regulator [Solirubrobacteraceae bacterium]|nr:TetR family transcriptional regulator [Solirubrobacteraceae bacterium]
MTSLTRSSGVNRTARRQEAHDKLSTALESALRAGTPFTRITVDELIEQSGVPRSTFYLYYADKSHLLRAVSSGLSSAYLEACEDWWHLPPDGTREDLRRAFDRMLESYLPHQHLLAAVIETSSYDHEVSADYRSLLELHFDEVAEHIRRGQADGSVAAHVDADHAARWITHLVERGLYEFAADAADDERERYLTAWTDIVWNALYAAAR